MALNGDALGLAIKAAIDGVGDKSNRDNLFKAMGDAIVAYLVAHAQVVVTNVSGVQVGMGSSGPGTGTLI